MYHQSAYLSTIAGYLMLSHYHYFIIANIIVITITIFIIIVSNYYYYCWHDDWMLNPFKLQVNKDPRRASSRGSHPIAVERHGQGPTGGFCPHRGRIGTHEACPAASWCRQLEVAGFPSMELPLIAGWFFGNGKIPWMTVGTPICSESLNPLRTINRHQNRSIQKAKKSSNCWLRLPGLPTPTAPSMAISPKEDPAS